MKKNTKRFGLNFKYTMFDNSSGQIQFDTNVDFVSSIEIGYNICIHYAHYCILKHFA